MHDGERGHEPEPVARRVGVGEAGGSARDTPWPSTASRILDLQRRAGNRAVGRLLDRPGDVRVLQRSIFDTLAEVIEEVVHTVADPIGTAERLIGIGDVRTVTDPVALIRSAPPELATIGGTIPLGSEVVVVDVAHTAHGKAALVEEHLPEGISGAARSWGWTMWSNLGSATPAAEERDPDDELDEIVIFDPEDEPDVPVVPSRPRTEEERLAELIASRESATVETVRERDLFFVNPPVLSAFPLKMEGGERRDLFKKTGLIGLLSAQVTLPAQHAKALERKEKQLAAATKARDRSDFGSDRWNKRDEKVQELTDELDRMREEHRARLDRLDAEILAKAEAIRPRIIKALEKRHAEAALASLETEGAVVRIHQRDIQVSFDGDAMPIMLHAVNPGVAVDRPELGVKEGGDTRFSQDLVTAEIDEALTGVTDPATRARRQELMSGVLGALFVAEGRADSFNTWDSARLTMGPGIAAAGGLQGVFWHFKNGDPDRFHELIGRFGIDIDGPRVRGAVFTVTVPPDDVRTDSARDIPGGTVLRDNAAEAFIGKDPVLMAQLRRASRDDAFQRVLIEGALVSVAKGEAFAFRVRGVTIRWADLIAPLGVDYLVATQAVAANWAHGTGSTASLADKVAPAFDAAMRREGLTDPRDHGQLSQDGRMALVTFMAGRLKKGRRKAFRSQFDKGPELWPA
jgi:hypothetical protein